MRGDLYWIATLLVCCLAKLLYHPSTFSKFLLVIENMQTSTELNMHMAL